MDSWQESSREKHRILGINELAQNHGLIRCKDYWHKLAGDQETACRVSLAGSRNCMPSKV